MDSMGWFRREMEVLETEGIGWDSMGWFRIKMKVLEAEGMCWPPRKVPVLMSRPCPCRGTQALPASPGRTGPPG